MQEIKIPDGCKASIDFEKRVVVIEEESFSPKKGDIVYCEYYDYGGSSWVAIVNTYSQTFKGLNIVDLIIKSNSGNCHKLKYGDSQTAKLDICRLATTSEQQLLFDALAKEGKKWNETTLQIEDIEKDILVPESIGIYKHKTNLAHGLFLGFNSDSQMLGYHRYNKQWIVISEIHKYEKVQCKLTPCNREDLKAGDTAFFSETFRLDNGMLSDLGRYVKIICDKAIKINKKGEPIYDNSFHNNWYKVEPINK